MTSLAHPGAASGRSGRSPCARAAERQPERGRRLGRRGENVDRCPHRDAIVRARDRESGDVHREAVQQVAGDHVGHRLKRSWGEFQALTVEQLGLPRLAHAHAQALAPELLEAERDVVAETQHQETALAPDLDALLPQECPDGLCRDEVVKHAGTRPAGHVGRRSGQQLEPVRPALPCPVETGIQGGQMRREPGHDGVAAAVIDLHGRIMSGCRTLVKYSGFYSSGASRDCLARSEPPTLLRRGAGMISGTDRDHRLARNGRLTCANAARRHLSFSGWNEHRQPVWRVVRSTPLCVNSRLYLVLPLQEAQVAAGMSVSLAAPGALLLRAGLVRPAVLFPAAPAR